MDMDCAGPQGGYDKSGSEWECDGRLGRTVFSALSEFRAPSPRMQSSTPEAQPTQSGGLFVMDVTGGLFVMARSFLGRDRLCLNLQDSQGDQRCKLMQ